MVVVVVTLLLLIIGGSIFASLPPTGTPAQIGTFTLTGDRTRGYTAFFYLKSAQQAVVVSDGMVTLTIYDSSNNTVYSNSFQLKSGDFSQYQNVLFGGTVWGHQWDISASQVQPSTANAFGVNYGSAKLTFTTSGGATIAATTSLVNLGSS